MSRDDGGVTVLECVDFTGVAVAARPVSRACRTAA